ncbi:4Fe-4S ferredoxin iron-sulfur binding domain protein [Methanococcus aeolicus Nankai-3]|uniref:4Fe-4S ferredoxin iron-sulfur binding domain protein n=1 Tax=Methanococcus aeolicus (strain ATCC BAA-1280 / DSM 17508 / OCM 812 / Nankai-3) TaxID=419665 RepID=A6UV92_META3|nr:4Fe-4S dicluster domain-containing protein [Methanococcus aeolicus]ABR56414.1 4Fe-4S ferredoxin iron-sulfur binding domain protein [Methanococcus aeolicus Nankai-3]
MDDDNNKSNKWNLSLNDMGRSLTLFAVFMGYALFTYFKTKNIFLIFNFVYIGSSIALGLFLINGAPRKLIPTIRRIILFLIGIYLLVYVGFIRTENMQMEGFFFYLFGGIFAGSTIHYLIAKIFGPIIFGRGFCGWACWIVMIFELLPYKKSRGRIKNLGIVKYIVLFLSFGIVLYFWNRGYTIYNYPEREILWFVVGLLLYYLSGIILAFAFNDNRAFCKYLCPIPPIQNILGRFSLIKMSIDKDKCVDCGLCEKNCPMDIKLLDYKNENKRILSTECILCSTCSSVCPKHAISTKIKFDFGKDILNYKIDKK